MRRMRGFTLYCGKALICHSRHGNATSKPGSTRGWQEEHDSEEQSAGRGPSGVLAELVEGEDRRDRQQQRTSGDEYPQPFAPEGLAAAGKGLQ